MQTKGGRGFPPLPRYLSPLCLRGGPAAEDRLGALWKRDILRRCRVLALEKWDTSQTRSEKKEIKKKVFPKLGSIENGTLMSPFHLCFRYLLTRLLTELEGPTVGYGRRFLHFNLSRPPSQKTTKKGRLEFPHKTCPWKKRFPRP